MNTEPTLGRRAGLASWQAPILGSVIGVEGYLYYVIVNHHEVDFFQLVLFAGIGVIAGLVMWAIDSFRRDKVLNNSSPDETQQQSPVQIPEHIQAATLRRDVGKALVGLCAGLLFIGNFVMAVAFREFTGGELTAEKLILLVPIWAIGIIGAIMWLIPSRPQVRDSDDETRP